MQIFRVLLRCNPRFLLDRTWKAEYVHTLEGNPLINDESARVDGLTFARRVGSIHDTDDANFIGYNEDGINDVTVWIDDSPLRIDCVPGSEIDRCVADYLEKIEGFDFVW